MKKSEKAGPVVHHTHQSLEQRYRELCETFQSLDEGPVKQRLSSEIDDTRQLMNGLLKYQLDHSLAVNVTVSKVKKI